MKITFTINTNGEDVKNLQELGITSNDDLKESIFNYLAEQIDENFYSINEFSEFGSAQYNNDSLKFEIKLTENEKIILDNNVISDNIIIKSFTNRKNLPKNEKIYAFIDNGDLMDIEEAINKRIDFDKYLIFKEKGEQKGRFIDNLIECSDEDSYICWIDIENKRWDEFENLIFGYQELKKEVKEKNLGYFVYLYKKAIDNIKNI